MIDWDDAFDNSGYVPGTEQLLAQWAAMAADWRAQGGEFDLPYGDAPRNRLDLFRPKGLAKGVVIFIHGGYWQALDKSYWSHLATGPLVRDWAFAVPSYTLAPEAKLSNIVAEMRAAVKAVADLVAGPVRLVGHSAGGHLVARMACPDGPLPDRIEGVMPISGIHDLRPLLHSSMNDILHLTKAEAQAQSPALLPKRDGIEVSCWVGASERPELVRQTRLLSEAWAVPNVFAAGHDHFSIVQEIGNPGSALLNALLKEQA